MLEHLFGSKTRYKLLQMLFRDPDRIFFVRELTRALDTQINAVRREIHVLSQVGLLEESDVEKKEQEAVPGSGLRKYYKLNTECVYYGEIQALLLKANIEGQEKFIQEIQKKVGDIDLFILTGCFTSDKRAPVDLLLVGEVKEHAAARLIARYEKEFGCPLRYTFFTKKDFFDRRHVMDKFLFGVFEANHIKVINRIGV